MIGKKLKTAVVGLNFGEWVIENELIDGTGREYIDLVGVCDLDEVKTRSIGEKYGVRPFYSLGSLLRDKEVEAVILMTGPVGRAELVRQIIRCGKSVMTTKPFDTSSRNTASVLEEAQQQGIPVFMNSPTPKASGELLQIQQWIEQLSLGHPVGYHASTWCSYREEADGSWYDDPVQCPAAPVFRLGIYLLNDLCRFLAPVKNVQVLQSQIFTKRPTADNAQLNLLHEDGTIGSVYASFCIDDAQPYQCSLTLNFERGSIYKNVGLNHSGEIQLSCTASANGGKIRRECSIPASGAGYQWETFYRASRGEDVGETVAPAQVASVIRILEKMREQI